MIAPAKIYSLSAAGQIRYIGKTVQTLIKRLWQHLQEARGTDKNHRLDWIRSLKSLPEIRLIEVVTADDWEVREQYWIALAKAYGFRLVNSDAGGKGGHDTLPETREKQAAAKRGKKQTPEHIAKRVAANTGKKRSPEAVEKTASSRRGKTNTPEHNERVAAWPRGRRASYETRLKMSISKRKRDNESRTSK